MCLNVFLYLLDNADIWRRQCAQPSNALFLEPTWVSPLNGIIDRFSCFSQPTPGGSARMVQSYSPGSASVHPQLIRGSFDAQESVPQTASRSIQSFWQSVGTAGDHWWHSCVSGHLTGHVREYTPCLENRHHSIFGSNFAKC